MATRKTRTVQRGTKKETRRQFNSATQSYEVVTVDVPNMVEETYTDYSSSDSSYDSGSYDPYNYDS
jgi:hypothetical protein